LCANDTVDQAVIQGKREVDAFRDDNPTGPRDDSLVLASDSENARLAGIYNRFEAVGAVPADVRQRERNRRQIGLQQPTQTGAPDGVLPRLCDFINRSAR
jgi:hypothetical protein